MIDDYVFPTTQAGMRAAGMILESGDDSGKKENGDAVESSDFETRSLAMSSVLTWIDEGSYTYDALDEAIVTAADLDGDFEINEDEENVYGDIWEDVPYALIMLGASLNDAQKIYDGPSKEADEAASRVGEALKAALDEEPGSDTDLILNFAMGEGEIFEGVFEANYKNKLVMHDGIKTKERKRVSGTVRLSAARKAQLRKARRKAGSARARRKAMKSRKKGEKMGLYK